MTEPSITCPVCERTSHYPNDVTQGYCAACHDWTGAVRALINPFAPAEIEWAVLHRDRQGHPITLARWVWLYEHHRKDYALLARDELDDGILVVTVWNGVVLEVACTELFSTAILVDGKLVSECGYTTEAEALATHATLKRSLEYVGRSFLDGVLQGAE